MEKVRAKITINGVVQGVGFRPFIFNLAKEKNLKGFIKNFESGVYIEVEGEKENILSFIKEIPKKKPKLSFIYSLEYSLAPPVGYTEFKIEKSSTSSFISTLVLPDISTCKDCLKELFDKNDRRYRYPFINCTNCGPRFTIIEKLPYDRKNTSMKYFQMCKECQKEYNDPQDRRFHAQPNACFKCGPYLYLISLKKGLLFLEKNPYKTKKEILDFLKLTLKLEKIDYENNKVILKTSQKNYYLKVVFVKDLIDITSKLIKKGYIFAIKGLGGFHLVADALNEETVKLLRARKHRPAKPFALMFPNLESIKNYCFLEKEDIEALESIEKPIVLLRKKREVKYIAPDNPYFGVFLPYTPLYHLLLNTLKSPIICTSANISGEPLIKDDMELIENLENVFDFILSYNRPIVRGVDDSVLKAFKGKRLLFRRARGYAPFPAFSKKTFKGNFLALGGNLKNTFSFSLKDRSYIFISPHIGDLENKKTYEYLKSYVQDFLNLYKLDYKHLDAIVIDAHPKYLSSLLGKEIAQKFNIPLYKVYHHHSHIVTTMFENEIEKEVLGFSFDGTGYGKDGTIWGGEALISSYTSFKRVATIHPFLLIGGDKAIKEPWKILFSLLYEIYEKDLEKIYFILKKINPNFFDKEKSKIFYFGLKKKINAIKTTSMGRLFDAVSVLFTKKLFASFEGELPIALENLAWKVSSIKKDLFPTLIKEKDLFIWDWRKDVKFLIENYFLKGNYEEGAYIFHSFVKNFIISVSSLLKEKHICLGGGVFQNNLLLKLLFESFKGKIYISQKYPLNDGGISVGQLVYLNKILS